MVHKYDEIANDYSNICSFSSKLKLYNDALLEGMQSVAFNQLTLLNENLYNRKYNKLDKTKSLNSNKKALYSRMMLSYFNIGVQQEHLKRTSDCEISYNRSRALAAVIGDKEIIKRLSKSANTAGNRNSNSNNNNSNHVISSHNSRNNFSMQNNSNNNTQNLPNFTLYSADSSEIK